MRFIIECEEIMAPVVENMMARLGDGVKLSPYVEAKANASASSPRRWKGRPYASVGGKPNNQIVKTFTIVNGVGGNVFKISLSPNALETRIAIKSRDYKWDKGEVVWKKTVPDQLVQSEIDNLVFLGIEFKG